MMEYKITELANMSEVSIRTLRFYDEINLLKPAFYDENGHRFYREEQLMRLQQILFYRELNFSLNDIHHVLKDPDFSKIDALKSHKKKLEDKLHRVKKLLVTLDKTIAHFSGEKAMNTHEIYDGFDIKDLPKYDEIAIQELGPDAEKLIEIRDSRTKQWDPSRWEKLHKDWNELLLEFTSALKQELSPSDCSVQEITKRQYQLIDRLYSPTPKEYLDICRVNCNHPDYKKQFDFYHPQLADFVQEAMKIFARNEFKL